MNRSGLYLASAAVLAALTAVDVPTQSPVYAGDMVTHATMAVKTAGASETPSFSDMMTAAFRKMQSLEPEAVLYEAICRHPEGMPTTNPDELTACNFYFRLPLNRTGHITASSRNSISDPQIIGRPWLGNRVVAWPLHMDLVEANALLQSSEHAAPYVSVTLRWPLPPGCDQPYYIFRVAGGSYIAVGTVDKQVSIFR